MRWNALARSSISRCAAATACMSSGRVRATVRQTCVVTLEPVVNEIDEAVDVDFVPPRAAAAKADAADEIDLEASGPDEPEPLTGNAVDLGLLATEFLLLGVDPYPRKPGVAFEAPKPGDPAGAPVRGARRLGQKGHCQGIGSARTPFVSAPPNRYCPPRGEPLHTPGRQPNAYGPKGQNCARCHGRRYRASGRGSRRRSIARPPPGHRIHPVRRSGRGRRRWSSSARG